MAEPEFRLSEKAKNDFKKLMFEEFGEEISDDQAYKDSERVLRLFQIVVEDLAPRPKVQVTEVEARALKHIHHALHHENAQPTVRGLAEAIGRSSSRSGQKILATLVSKGLVIQKWREEIILREDIDGCDTILFC